MTTNIPPRPELVAATICVVAITLLGACYLIDLDRYLAILSPVTVQPWSHPFIDWEYMVDAASCWRQGVDVYAGISCHKPVPNLPYDYSPLLLRTTFLPTNAAMLNAAGLGMAAAFVWAVVQLRAPRTWFAVAVTTLSVVSSETIFAIERGNMDVLVFALAVAGVLLWAGPGIARFGAYAIFTAVGLMKYYGFVLLVLALRERRRELILVGVGASTVLAAFVALYADEIVSAVRGVPGGSPFRYWIGAMILPAGVTPRLAPLLGLGEFERIVARLIWAALCGLVVLAGAWLATTGGVSAALGRTSARERGLLLAGALTMGGCFIAGNSQGYRAIFVLLALPGLLAFARDLPSRAARAAFRVGCGLVPFVMWAPFIKKIMIPLGLNTSIDGAASPAGMVHFVLNELAWWWLMVLLFSAAAAFLLISARQLWAEEPASISGQPFRAG